MQLNKMDNLKYFNHETNRHHFRLNLNRINCDHLDPARKVMAGNSLNRLAGYHSLDLYWMCYSEGNAG